MNSVLILLSTYNGQKYLREQLDSLYAQADVDVFILARDDGSKDETVKILEEYQSKNGRMSILAHSNIGCAKSFYTLIDYASTRMSHYDYYAFCDQDDVWQTKKLSKAVEKLDEHESSNKLYFSTANYVDANLNFIKKTNAPQYFDYKTCVFRNPVLGCTMVFDYAFLKIINTDFTKRISTQGKLQLHDAWAYKCANFLNTIIVNDENAYINYRQHGGNVTVAEKSLVSKYKNALTGYYHNKNAHLSNCKMLLETFGSDISEEKKKFLECLCDYDKNCFNTIKFLFVQPWRGESAIDRVLWILVVLFRLY